MSQLSAGTCLRLNNSKQGDEELHNLEHTLQLLSIKKVQSNPNAPTGNLDRYRVIISDGEHFLQAMLATQLNDLVYDHAIGKNTIAVIEKLTCNYIQGKRLVIILALRVLAKEAEKIGNPVAIPAAPEQSADASSSTTAIAPQQRQAAPPARGGQHLSIFPIEGLSPYQNNWTIKARVTQKSDIKTWSNQRGEGKLFNVTLMDESAEIKATGFNIAVDELYDKFEEGKVYFVSKARVNLAKKKFSNVNNDYELSLERNTEVEECFETNNVPMVKYNFVPLSSLEELTKDTTCDVIGVVKEIGALGDITSKMNKTIPKREITIVDKSGYSVRLTLWGKQAEQFNCDGHPVIAFKGVKVGDFGGRSLSMYSSSTMAVNPEIDECFSLKGWYDSSGAGQSFQSHSGSSSAGGFSGGFNRADIRSLNDVKESQLGMSDKADYFSARATIMFIKPENISYPACPSQGCQKKVVPVGDQWRCEKCDRNFDKPEHRYIISFAVADWSGQAWLQGFNDAGLAVFGLPADTVVEMKDRSESEYNVLLHKCSGATFNFSCRAKQDTFNDQTRVRYGISKIMPLDYHEEACALRDLLHSPWAK